MALRCDLILVTWNKLAYTKPCVESLLQHTSDDDRLIIVDNGSAEDTITFLDDLAQRHPKKVLVIEQASNLGWCKAVNAGVRQSEASYVCLLNNDLVVTAGWLDRMIAVAERDLRIGLVNPTYNRRGESWAAFAQRAQGRALNGAAYLEVNECNGACLLIRREVIERLGGLDEVYGLGGMDDSDYSRSVQVAGFRCARAKDAYVFHWENVTYNTVPDYWTTLRRRNEEIFQACWGSRKQIVVVMDPSPAGQWRRLLEQCLALARLGVRIHLVGLVPAASGLTDQRTRWEQGMVEHNNVKWQVHSAGVVGWLDDMRLGGMMLGVAMKALGRRSKTSSHTIQAFIGPSPSARRWLRMLQGVHGTAVYACFEDAPFLQQELKWARAIDQAPWQHGAAAVS